MLRAKLDVELATQRIGNTELTTRFLADSQRGSTLAILAIDLSGGDGVGTFCDSFNYDEIKRLLNSTDDIIRRLNGQESLMPTNVIPNPMWLKVDVGDLKVETTHVRYVIEIDRFRSPNVFVSFSDWDTGELILINMNASDYQRFKRLISDTDHGLDELYAQKQINERFLIK